MGAGIAAAALLVAGLIATQHFSVEIGNGGAAVGDVAQCGSPLSEINQPSWSGDWRGITNDPGELKFGRDSANACRLGAALYIRRAAGVLVVGTIIAVLAALWTRHREAHA